MSVWVLVLVHLFKGTWHGKSRLLMERLVVELREPQGLLPEQ